MASQSYYNNSGPQYPDQTHQGQGGPPGYGQQPQQQYGPPQGGYYAQGQPQQQPRANTISNSHLWITTTAPGNRAAPQAAEDASLVYAPVFVVVALSTAAATF